MSGAGWLEEKLSETHTCPVCSADHPGGNKHLEKFRVLARELESISASVSKAPAKLEHELAERREELRVRETALSKARKKRQFLESRSTELSAQRQRVRQIYLFVGRVEQALENVVAGSNVGDLRDRVKKLSNRVAEIRKKLDPRSQKEREKAAIDSVSSRIYDYARELQLEHAADPSRVLWKIKMA